MVLHFFFRQVFVSAAESPSATKPPLPPRFGKDHLTLADWPLGTATFQQRTGESGEQRDFAEFVIDRPDGTRQKVTLESPSRIGLPTAGDHDTVIGLLLLAKQQDFQFDVVRFMPWQLLQIMGWPLNQKSLDRLQASLKRLKAVTATYENVWYHRKTRLVESCLITGILAEAKIVFHKGRRAAGVLPESYVQWTRHVQSSLEEGSVLDLNLDLYFSCRRPGAKHLLRHLNKVWHAGRKPKPYARDLKELACGHLGMTDCKDLKRNFQELVAELESCGYLTPVDPDTRYEKIRPGVWRVHLELHSSQSRAGSNTTTLAKNREEYSAPARDDARELVQLYHRHRFGRSDYQPERHELARARTLLGMYDADTLTGLVPSIARTVERQYRGGDLYFGSAVPCFTAAIERRQKKQAVREVHANRETDETADEAAIMEQKRQRYERRQQLLRQWELLSVEDRQRHLDAAIACARSEFDQRRLSRASLDEPPREVLEEMDCALRESAPPSELASV